MSDKDKDAAIGLIDILIAFGIPAGQALYRAIRALYGHDLTEEEISTLLLQLSQDAHIRSLLAHADAAGGDDMG